MATHISGNWPWPVPGFFSFPPYLFPLHHLYWSRTLNVHFGYCGTYKHLFRHELQLEIMNGIVAYLLGYKDETPPSKLLDMGCGYGATVSRLLGFFPNATITGINNDEAQLKVAKERLATSKYSERAAFLLTDFQATGFQADSFDAVYALESACFAEGETKSKLLAEAERVLRPGGKLVMVDGFRKHGWALPKPIDWLYRKSLAAWGIPSLAPIDGFVVELKAYGFTKITVKDISWNILPSLAHFPVTAMKLFFFHLVENDREQLRYIHALLLTLSLSPFKRHFGYYSVTCVKSAVELKN